MRTLLVLFLICPFFSKAQQSENTQQRAKIYATANAMGKAFVAKDYETMIDYMYKPAVEKLGGRDSLLSVMKLSLKQMANQGMVLNAITFGLPTDIKSCNNSLQSIISQQITLTTPMGKVQSTASLLAISENGGDNWFYIDVTQKDIDQLVMLVPKICEDLEIPAWKEPVFISN